MNLRLFRKIFSSLIFLTGAIELLYFLLHDRLQGNIPHYGFNDVAAIVVGTSFVCIGLLLFVFEKYSLFEKAGFFSTKVNLLESLLIIILVAILFGAGGMTYCYNKYVLNFIP